MSQDHPFADSACHGAVKSRASARAQSFWTRTNVRGYVLRLRKCDPETAAGGCGFNCEIAAVNFHGPLGNRQTQAGSAVLAGTSLVDAVETIKDSRSKFGRDTGA